jgi:hypothetical protein
MASENREWGYDRIVGALANLGYEISQQQAPHDIYVQVADKGQRIRAAKLREADERSNTLHRAMLHYAHAYLLQPTATALLTGGAKSRSGWRVGF